MDPLPIDAFIPAITAALERRRAAVVVAEPGAGKTTRVPPALVGVGPVLLLQPRRAAARAIARRIADERSWTIGREVGWQIRFERRFSSDTQLLVATEGILTARLQQDPLLSTFATVVLDEFHERSVHLDLGIALAREAWRARGHLRLLVMSATLDAESVSAFLDDCPIIRVPGRLHPLEISYSPRATVSDAVVELSRASRGDMLCFLPGALEIQRAVAQIRAAVQDADVLPLHGSLDAQQQDMALAPPIGAARRIIVSTNIAETSVTVPRVTAVVDSGLQKVARYDAARAIDSLATERITQDAADQRAGRAGRVGPGAVRRLWEASDRLRPHREPDIHRIDLSSTALEIVGWGGDPRTFAWFEAPRRDAIDAAMELLGRLGAIAGGRLTPIGRQMQSIALHPRLARILIEGAGDRAIARTCAMLSERLFLAPRSTSTASDLLSALDDWKSLPGHIHQVAREIEQLARHLDEGATPAGPSRRISDEDFRRAMLSGYPDRVAQRREPGSSRLKLSSGAGATLAPESGVTSGEFLIAVDVQASTRVNEPESRIRVASGIEASWLTATARERIHRLDEAGTVRAAEIVRYDSLVLSETPAAIDEEKAARLLAEAWLTREPPADEARLLRRVKFAGARINLGELVLSAAYGARSVSSIRLHRALAPDLASIVDRDAPDMLAVPSGRSVRLEYADDGSVAASVKLQELFGLGETPRIGPRQEPVRLSLLAPNGRPVQVTRDLRSFWDRTYPEVRKELRGRYPRHPWPEDPWNAPPTARTTRRKK